MIMKMAVTGIPIPSLLEPICSLTCLEANQLRSVVPVPVVRSVVPGGPRGIRADFSHSRSLL